MTQKFKETEIGKIPEDWEVSEVGNLVNHKKGFAFKSEWYKDEGVRIIKVSNLTNNSISFQNCTYIDEELAKEYEEYELRPDDIIIATVGSWPNNPDSIVGKVIRVPKNITKELLNQNAVRLRVKDAEASSQSFLYYRLKYKDFSEYIVSGAQGSANQASITLKDIFNFEFGLPSFEEQKRIVNILEAFDDKIDLNRQINQTLEAMAQAMFKSWFVDFEPVKAKIAAIETGENAEGITRAAMSAVSGKTDEELEQLQAEQPDNYTQLKTTAELFPSTMQDSELGEVPDEWEISTIGDEVGVVGGGTPSTKNPEFWEGGEIHWTTPKDLSNLSDKILLTTDRKITVAGLKNISSGLLPINTVLMSSRAPVGYLALAKIPVAINQGYIAMICDNRLSPEFVIQWCNSVMETIKQRSSGTTFAEISKKNFKVIPVIVPSKEIQQSYSKLVSGFYNKIAETAMECKTLSDIRDSLLPKLLSGEITP